MTKSSGPRCILELKLRTTAWQDDILAKKFRCAERMYNIMVRHARKCIELLKQNNMYQELLSEYCNCPDTEGDQKLKKKIGKELTKIVRTYNLSEYDFHAYISKIKNESFEGVLDIDTTQKLATRVWQAVEKVLYSDGKEIHFKKRGSLESLESKKNSSGIKFNLDFMECRFQNLKIPVKIRKNDLYAYELLTHKICYCRIIRKPFKTGYKYSLQLVLNGKPLNKSKLGNGKVGIDMGTSTIAAVGESNGLLIAHGNNMLAADKSKNKTVESYNKEIIKLNRKLEHQRRFSNSQNYNEDGTIKKGSSQWVHTNNYYKTLFKLKDAYRRKSAFIKQQHCTTANKILELGNEFITEPMNWKSLQKRSKSNNKDKTQQSDSKTTTKEPSTKQIKRKSKKRFGKSLNNHSPAMLEEIIKQKLNYHDLTLNYVNISTYRASQYNPETDDYIKHGLNTRQKKIFEHLIQRDLLSAFLLQNPLKDLANINTETVKRKFNNFLSIHDNVIKSIKNIPNLPKCVGV